MKLSTAICTWNRASLLASTLDALSKVDVPSGCEWELVIVDNNCTDDTPSVIESFKSKLPIVAVNEPQQGHSHSRNRAIATVTGDYLIWTDDDVWVDKNWLNAYVDAFQRYPEAAFFGGTIEPRFESDPPKWLEENWQRCAGVFATRSFGDEEFAFDEKKLPFGANFAIKTELQKQYNYDPRFGRVTDAVVRGYDEIDVLRQLLRDGHTGYWIPAAKLDHFIPTDRMTIDYVRKFYEGQGETWIVRGQATEPSFQLYMAWVGHLLGYYCHRCFGTTHTWFDHVVKASRAKGKIRSRRQLSLSKA